MRTTIRFLFCLFLAVAANAQKSIDKTLRKLNKESVPYVQAEELSKTSGAILLDTRKKEEYNVSHLKNATWVGYKEFVIDSTMAVIQDKDSEIVVYCSVGVRSEDIGEKLLKAGFTNVKNLYGGIFEWKNNGLPVYDTLGNQTDRVHAFNKQWGKLLKEGEKVYGKKKVVSSQ